MTGLTDPKVKEGAKTVMSVPGRVVQENLWGEADASSKECACTLPGVTASV